MNGNTFDLGRGLTQQYEFQAGISEALLLEFMTERLLIGLGRLFKPRIFQSLWSVIRRRLARRILVLFFMLVPLASYGQWLEVSPMSLPLWGQSPQVAKVSLGYRSAELVYLYGFKTLYDHQDGAFGGEYFGIFWNPLTVEKGLFKVTGGAGYFFREYPTMNGTHINFSLKLLFRISESISIQYGHISNGFSVFNNINPGVDNIGLVIVF